MNERVKTKDRVFFSREKKEKILHKSKGVCAHCGKELDLETMTVDHVIPLSKGGTNELKNLVALCEDCNRGKCNYVVDPEDYFKYLNWIYLKDLNKYFKEYSEQIEWVSKRQTFSEDMQFVSTISGMGVYNHRGKCLVKAMYSDLDDIYYAYIKYHDRKANFRYTRDDREILKDFIKMIFMEGCFYIYRNSCGDIALVVPVLLALVEDDKGRERPVLFLPKVLLVYKKIELSTLFLSFVAEVFRKGLRWNRVGDTFIQSTISVFEESPELEHVLNYFKEISSGEEILHKNNKIANYISMTVFTGDLEKYMKSVNKEKDIIEFKEEELVNFCEDLGVLRMSIGMSMYFLTRSVCE